MTPSQTDKALLAELVNLTTEQKTFVEAMAAFLMPHLEFKRRDGYEQTREIATIIVLRYYAGLIP